MAVVIGAIMIIIMVTLGVFIVLAVGSAAHLATGGQTRPFPAQEDAVPRPGLDTAQEELRLRYARGEIDREEFLQRKIDLEF